MSRWQPERKEVTRQRILEAAAHLFRERGYANTSVSDVMHRLGLTVGGFYSHFESKEALLSEVIADGMDRMRSLLLLGMEQAEGSDFIREVAKRYLSRFHRDHPEQGCILPALAAEVGRHGSAPRSAIELYLREITSFFAKKFASGRTAPPKARGDGDDETASKGDVFAADELALALTALSVGGVLLARAVEDRSLSDSILRICRRFANHYARRAERT
ncbi:TetR/AcrR family transcriptional regulator [Pendulispora albinea]|uniref:TetR/AcrR family transcriptional regulator n=1 Tax=Pendulispora albinea TaxID=2741071 RepID=A0ABZ2M170_9BACT